MRLTLRKQITTALEEKDAQIEELSAQLGAIEEQIAKGELAPPPPVPKTRSELEEWGDELEKESAKLTQERPQTRVVLVAPDPDARAGAMATFVGAHALVSRSAGLPALLVQVCGAPLSAAG